MALADVLGKFLRAYPAVKDIFYATTPPAVLVSSLAAGGFNLGNLFVATQPHVFIGPDSVLDQLQGKGYVKQHTPFASSRGNVMLIRAGNPKKIHSVGDLARADVRVFLSNPKTETASYAVYAQTLRQTASAVQVQLDLLNDPAPSRVVYGERIHHREAPQALAEDRADVAIVYFHLALRYTRIFPKLFDMAFLDGQEGGVPRWSESNVRTTYHVGVIGDGGLWGRQFAAFLCSAEGDAIYSHHGLMTSQTDQSSR